MRRGELSAATRYSDVGLTSVDAQIQSGRVPYFDRPNQNAVLLAISQHQLPARPPDMIDWLWEVITTCCVIEPAQRASSASVLRWIQTLRVMSPILSEAVSASTPVVMMAQKSPLVPCGRLSTGAGDRARHNGRVKTRDTFSSAGDGGIEATIHSDWVRPPSNDPEMRSCADSGSQ